MPVRAVVLSRVIHCAHTLAHDAPTFCERVYAGTVRIPVASSTRFRHCPTCATAGTLLQQRVIPDLARAAQRYSAACCSHLPQGASASWLAWMQPLAWSAYFSAHLTRRARAPRAWTTYHGRGRAAANARFCALFAWLAVFPLLSPKRFHAYLVKLEVFSEK